MRHLENPRKTGALSKASPMGFAAWRLCVSVAFALVVSLFLFAGIAGAQNFFPLKDVRPGLRGVGRTVFQGERIDEFQVEVLGVLENLAPHQTIVLARLSGGPLAETGVLQGMSGSPVYIDGKLLGAVALGFPFSKEPIAGIQPIESMISDSLLSAPRRQAAFSPRATPPGELSNLPIPVSFSGFSAGTAVAYSSGFSGLGFRLQPGMAQPAGKSPTDAASEIVPGSMISVGLITGDMNMTADGTVTFVDGRRIYAFGHRFLDTGPVEMPFAHAEVIASIPTLNASFKLSVPHAWIGAILSDRTTAVAGEIGRSAHTIPLTITVDSTATGNHIYRMQMVNDRLLTPLLSQTALFSTLDATERSIGAGTLRIEGRAEFEGGLPALTMRDVYVSDNALAQQAAGNAVVPLGFVVGGGFADLRLKSLTFVVSQLDTKRQLRLAQAWASAHEAHPGDTVTITALLQGDNGYETTKSESYHIPVGAPNGPLNFTIGDATQQNFADFAGLAQSSLQTPRHLIEAINSYRSSEGLYVRVWRPQPSFSVAGTMPGGEMPDPPPSAMLILADPSSSAYANTSNAATRGSEVGFLTIKLSGFAVSGAKTVQVDIQD
jgi:hypothetical protein